MKSIHHLRLKSKGTVFSNLPKVKFDFTKYEVNSSPSLKNRGDGVFKFTKTKFEFTKYEAYALPSFKSKGTMFSDSPGKNLTSSNTKPTHCIHLRVCLHKITNSMCCLRLIKNKKTMFRLR
jgi:hypothetical protein